jgi:hypothetical protein
MGSSQVLVLRVSAPQDNAVAAEVTETLKGKALSVKKVDFGLGQELEEEEVKAAFGGKTTVTAVLVLSDKRDKAEDEADGALEIETSWFGVVRRQGKLVLEKDKRDLFAVWAGSARMLAAAARYAQTDPAAEFPVRSSTSWGEPLKLGKLTGPATGCMLADFGKPMGRCVLVLAEAGDRVCRAASEGGKLADATTPLKLRTASKAAAVGDFDGDGRIDLLSWDGRSLKLSVQTPAGTFAAPRDCGSLAECLSLDCIDVGGPRPGLVAGTSQGPVLLTWGAGGALTAQPLGGSATPETLAKLEPGGLCVVADFNGSGRADVMALFSKGAQFYAAEGTGRFKALVEIDLPLVDQPRVALCGDYDADGLLDVLVAGKDGLALLSRESPQRWSNVTYLTGELAYHGNANRPQIVGCAPCDVNIDGRQGMAMFYADRKPLVFFNRGFACFGWARELDLDPSTAVAEPGAEGVPAAPLGQPKPEAAAGPEDLKQGQAAGVVVDLDGDGVPDMLAVGAKEREIWAVFGRREDRQSRRNCTLTLPASSRGPVTVTVRDDKRVAGMYVVRPGVPTLVGRAEAGPMVLGWLAPNGRPVQREVVVLDQGARYEIKPDSPTPEEK